MALYEGIALIQEKQAVVLDLGTDYTKFGFTGEAAPRCIIPSEYWCAAERRHKRVYDYKDVEELYDNLVHMLHILYFRHVLVNPKERKVVVVESLFTPTQFRETLAKVLFLHYEVSGVLWADSPRLCALTLGAPVVLVEKLIDEMGGKLRTWQTRPSRSSPQTYVAISPRKGLVLSIPYIP
ncbi:jg15138 [Pararge aegeria aegeria]|uniref:Jg15138 protein n=1 Tax=Pararge aegeria aegeria TaxID=348720 RepID=A0A8S4S2Y5_9NEOP|nr:jg15138 [Pararge aegeria aegeria]